MIWLTPARKAGRLMADLHLSLLSYKSTTPVSSVALQPTTCPSSPVDYTDLLLTSLSQFIALPKLPTLAEHSNHRSM